MTSFGVASMQPWNQGLAERLSGRTGHRFIPIRSREDLSPDWLTERGIDTVFLPHWSHIIPREVFEDFKCVIFHMTDLPYGRGGSPLQNLIVRGHAETVMSALRCTAELDAGPVYMKRPLSLHGSAEEIFLRADGLIEEMILEMHAASTVPRAQEGEPVEFQRRKPEEGDWSGATTLDEVFDHIRMLDADGYPPAFVRVGPWKIMFSRASRRVGSVDADVRIEFSPEDESQ